MYKTFKVDANKLANAIEHSQINTKNAQFQKS